MTVCLLRALLLSVAVYWSNIEIASADELSTKETRHAFVKLLSQMRAQSYIDASLSFTQSEQMSRYIDAWRTTYRDEFVGHALTMFYQSQESIKNEADLLKLVSEVERRIPAFQLSREHQSNPGQFSDIFSIYLIDALDQVSGFTKIKILSEAEAALHYQLKQLLNELKVEQDLVARALVLQSNRVVVLPSYSAVTDAVVDHIRAFNVGLIYQKDSGTWITALSPSSHLKPATDLVDKLLQRKSRTSTTKVGRQPSSIFQRCRNFFGGKSGK